MTSATIQTDQTAEEQEELFAGGYFITKQKVKIPAVQVELGKKFENPEPGTKVFALVELSTTDTHFLKKECMRLVDATVLDTLVVPRAKANALRNEIRGVVKPSTDKAAKSGGNVRQLKSAVGIILGKRETYANSAALLKLSPDDLKAIAKEIGVDLAGTKNKSEAVDRIMQKLEAGSAKAKGAPSKPGGAK